MKNLIKQLLRENLQLADKVYFKTGKLSLEDKKEILSITNGDPYTKIISDFFFNKIQDNKTLVGLYNQLKQYNKNIFPIKGFNINGVDNIPDLVKALTEREKIINIFGKWPSIAKRNMQKDIRTERNGDEMYNYRDIVEYADSFVEMLNNRNEDAKKAILMKMFPNNATLEDVIDFAQEKENLLGGVDLTRKQIDEILKNDSEQYNELDVKYNKGNIMIIEVSGPNGIKEIGCNSVWCFSYNRNSDNNLKDWANNSTNGYCYVIIDFNKPSNSDTFMHVLTKPLRYDYLDYGETGSERLYTMSNRDVHDDEYDDEYSITVNEYIEKLIDLPTAMKIMNFGLSTPKDQNEKQFNSNQIELNEIKKILREGLITEAIYNIDDDVDLIYDNFFKEDLEDLLKTRKLNFGMFYNMITDTSILNNPLCVKANEQNPCKMLINSSINMYNPNTKTISFTVSKKALEFVKENDNDLDKALDSLDYYELKKFKADLSEEKIKGSIHHELTHWLDDTFNNHRVKRAVDRFMKKNKKVGRNNMPIDADTLEIQAQIHNIHQLKRKYQDIWDTLTFNEMMNMSITIRIVYNNLPLKYRDRWVRDLKTRMYREGLLGKKMY